MDAIMKSAADRLDGMGRNQAEASLKDEHIVLLASIYWLRTALVKQIDRRLVIPLWLGAVAMTANALGLNRIVLRLLGIE